MKPSTPEERKEVVDWMMAVREILLNPDEKAARAAAEKLLDSFIERMED